MLLLSSAHNFAKNVEHSLHVKSISRAVFLACYLMSCIAFNAYFITCGHEMFIFSKFCKRDSIISLLPLNQTFYRTLSVVYKVGVPTQNNGSKQPESP